MVYYPVPLHEMKVFEGRCKLGESFKETERATKEVLSLPIEPLLSKEELQKLVQQVNKFFE